MIPKKHRIHPMKKNLLNKMSSQRMKQLHLPPKLRLDRQKHSETGVFFVFLGIKQSNNMSRKPKNLSNESILKPLEII